MLEDRRFEFWHLFNAPAHDIMQSHFCMHGHDWSGTCTPPRSSMRKSAVILERSQHESSWWERKWKTRRKVWGGGAEEKNGTRRGKDGEVKGSKWRGSQQSGCIKLGVSVIRGKARQKPALWRGNDNCVLPSFFPSFCHPTPIAPLCPLLLQRLFLLCFTCSLPSASENKAFVDVGKLLLDLHEGCQV